MTVLQEREGVTTVPYEIVCPDTTAISRPEWLALRKGGLGSSDVAAAMALTPWSSPYALYCDKRNLVPDHDQTDFFEWKLELETPILNWVEKRGWVDGPMQRHLMLRSIEYPFLLANPDGLTADCVVEAKTASGFDEKRWDDGLPDQYAIQAHVLMAVTGRRECFIPVMFDTKAPREFWVSWDSAVGEPMLDAAGKFWQQVVDGVEPDPDASEATMLALRERYYEPKSDPESAVKLPEKVRPWFALRDASLAIINKETEAINGIKAQLMGLMGNEHTASLDGQIRATWRPRKDGVRVFLFKDPKEQDA